MPASWSIATTSPAVAAGRRSTEPRRRRRSCAPGPARTGSAWTHRLLDRCPTRPDELEAASASRVVEQLLVDIAASVKYAHHCGFASRRCQSRRPARSQRARCSGVRCAASAGHVRGEPRPRARGRRLRRRRCSSRQLRRRSAGPGDVPAGTTTASRRSALEPVAQQQRRHAVVAVVAPRSRRGSPGRRVSQPRLVGDDAEPGLGDRTLAGGHVELLDLLDRVRLRPTRGRPGGRPGTGRRSTSPRSSRSTSSSRVAWRPISRLIAPGS